MKLARVASRLRSRGGDRHERVVASLDDARSLDLVDESVARLLDQIGIVVVLAAHVLLPAFIT